MRRGATTLAILALLMLVCLGTAVAAPPAAESGELTLQSGDPPPGFGDIPAPLCGGGIPGPGSGGGAVDSGDDDDYWDGVNNDQEPPRGHQPLLLQILESLWRTEFWLVI